MSSVILAIQYLLNCSWLLDTGLRPLLPRLFAWNDDCVFFTFYFWFWL